MRYAENNRTTGKYKSTIKSGSVQFRKPTFKNWVLC